MVHVGSGHRWLWAAHEAGVLPSQDKLDGFVPAHFLGWYLKVRRPRRGDSLGLPCAPSQFPSHALTFGVLECGG